MRAVLHQVADQAQVRLGREQPLLLRDVLLEDVGLQGAVQLGRVGALALGRDQVHAEDRHRRPGDRHAGRDVGRAGCRRTARPCRRPSRSRPRSGRPRRATAGRRSRGPSASACRTRPTARRRPRPRIILYRSLVCCGVAEAGELPDRPRPPAVAGRVEPAGERELPRPADPLEPGYVGAGRARRPARPRPRTAW